jgi:hypothetical protein
VTVSDTAATFRELIRLAKRGGADPRWLNARASELVELLLELEALRRAADPRKVKTMVLAREVSDADKALRSTGVTDRVLVLCKRFNLSRSRVHALLKVSCDTQDKSMVESRHDLPKRI